MTPRTETRTTPSPEEAEAALHQARARLADLDQRFKNGEMVAREEWDEVRHAADYCERVLEASTVAHARRDEERRRVGAKNLRKKLRSTSAKTTKAIADAMDEAEAAIRKLAEVTADHNAQVGGAREAFQQLSGRQTDEPLEDWIVAARTLPVNVGTVKASEVMKATVVRALEGVAGLTPEDEALVRQFAIGSIPAAHSIREAAAYLNRGADADG